MNALEYIASERELYQKCVAPVSSKYSLTAMELSVLLFLANNPQYDTAKEIVEKRHLTKSHVSISIRSLEERGYLKKEYRNGDHRTVHLVLLPASAEAVREGQAAQAKYMAILTQGFSESEREAISGYIERIHENVLKALHEF